jgi:hypothetical protein
MRQASGPYLIAQKFVKEILCREWVISDGKIAMAHAKSLLKDYDLDDILGCLDAIRDHIIEPPMPLQSLAALRKFEPALIERWHTYCKTPPPVYLTTQYQEWVKRTGKKQEPVESKPVECQLLFPSMLL